MNITPNFARQLRIIWIDAVISAGGSLQAKHICEMFGVTRYMAETDLDTFTSTYPARLVYSATGKHYTAAAGSASPFTSDTRRAVVNVANAIRQSRNDAVFVPQKEE